MQSGGVWRKMWGAVILSLEADKTKMLDRSKPQFPGCSVKLEFNCDSLSPDMLNFVTYQVHGVRLLVEFHYTY